MTTIRVTGAAGNVGRPLVTDLLDAGVTVRAVTRHPGSAGLPAALADHLTFLSQLAREGLLVTGGPVETPHGANSGNGIYPTDSTRHLTTCATRGLVLSAHHDR